jgi:hypothetical protein
MRDWMFYQLEDYYRAQREELLKEPIDPEAGDLTILELLDSSDDSEREHGLKLLRQLNVPLLGPDADRIQWKRKAHRPPSRPRYTLPPKLPKGSKLPDNRAYWSYSELVQMAKKAVPIIQKIWREHFGKWQRRSGDIDAYTIAAEYFAVDKEDVRRKPSGRHKPKT